MGISPTTTTTSLNSTLPSYMAAWVLLLSSWFYYWDTYERRGIDEQTHTTQSQKNADFITNDDPSKEQKRYAAFLSRWKSISGESPTSFPGDTRIPCLTRDSNPNPLHYKPSVITPILGGNVWKKELRGLQESLVLLQNLPSESNDALTDPSSDEEVSANNLQELSSDSEYDQENIQDPQEGRGDTNVLFNTPRHQRQENSANSSSNIPRKKTPSQPSFYLFIDTLAANFRKRNFSEEKAHFHQVPNRRNGPADRLLARPDEQMALPKK
ncbi:hypothetical protein TNCV_3554061 [Trichonephila clavipes]|nr:hypothetical protein TNCV_3554061 [Trichonephila clavipes]